MEKENLKLTSKISSLITDDLKKNTKHESLEHAAQILRNVIKLYVSDRIKTDRLPDIDNFNCRDEIFKIHHSEWQLPKTSASFLYIRRPRFFFFGT
jgi:hypothetical protein